MSAKTDRNNCMTYFYLIINKLYRLHFATVVLLATFRLSASRRILLRSNNKIQFANAQEKDLVFFNEC